MKTNQGTQKTTKNPYEQTKPHRQKKGEKMSTTIIELQDVKKIYKMNGVETPALRGVNLKINKGEFVAIMGPSGSGKSTLLHMVGALDTPTSGKVFLDGVDISTLKESDLARLTRKKNWYCLSIFQPASDLDCIGEYRASNDHY